MLSNNLPSIKKSANAKPDRISINSLWIFLGLLSGLSSALITIFFLTRYLGPEQFGVYSIAVSLTGIFLPFADLGFNLNLTKIVSAKPDSLGMELSKTISARSVLALLFWFIMAAAAYALGYEYELIVYIILLGLSGLIGSMAMSYVAAIRAIRKMKFESATLLIGNVAKMTAILAMIALNAGLRMIIFAHLLSSVVLLLAAIYFLRTQTGPLRLKFDLKDIKPRLYNALPFGLSAIFVTIYFKVDTIMLSKMVRASEVGYYNGAYNFIQASMLFSTPLVVAIFPVLAATYNKSRDNAETVLKLALVMTMLVGLPLGLGTYFMAEPLILLIYGKEFANSFPMLAIMAGAIPLLYATHLIGNSIGAVGFQKKVAAIAGINMVLNIVLNLILIPHFQGRGAAAATLLTELAGLIMLVWAARGIIGINISHDFIKLIICCVLSYMLFYLLLESTGPWFGALAFSAAYIILVFAVKIVSVAKIRNYLGIRGNLS